MERRMDESGKIPHQENDHYYHFGSIDFMDESNLDQFIDLIRGENNGAQYPIANFTNQLGYTNYDDHDIGGDGSGGGSFLADDHRVYFPPPDADDIDQLFDFNIVVSNDHVIDNMNSKSVLINDFPEFSEKKDDESKGFSAAAAGIAGATDTQTKKKTNNKVDRAKTLISEQKRRGRMKEKLYALRSLVPNITKMDKASIVGDAALYVQDLQIQATKLKSEIAVLESSSNNINRDRTIQNDTNMNVMTTFCPPIIKMISRMDVFQVEGRGFYVTIISNKGKDVAVFLYKAIESLITTFDIHSSNLDSSAENYVLTFTLHIKEPKMETNLPNLKLWISTAFINQGFDFITSPNA